MGKSLAAGLSTILPLLIFVPFLTPELSHDSESADRFEFSAGAAWATSGRREKLGRQCLDADQLGPGCDDDRARLALFYGGLVRKKQRARHHDAELHLDGGRHRSVGAVPLQLIVRIGQQFYRQSPQRVSQGRRSGTRCGLCSYDPSAQTFMVCQLMFTIITPALLAGAFAERMRFSAMLLFTVLWSVIVSVILYDPMAHMAWAKADF
jgi:hypothetical protein